MSFPPIPPIIEYPKNWITLIVFRGIVPRVLHFPVMPESFMGLKKYLVTVTPTLGGGFVDDFGFAPSPFTLTGTFGFNTKGFAGKSLYTGFGWIKYLEWMVDESHKPDLISNTMPEVWLLSWISDHYYKVILEDLNVSQTVNRNTIWQYTLRITALKPLRLEDPLGDDIFSTLKGQATKLLGAVSSVKKAGLNVAKNIVRIRI